MSSEPHGTPAAPERSGLVRYWPLGPASAVALLAVIATSALALGVAAAWLCAFAVAGLFVAAILLARSRAATRRLQAVVRALRASEYKIRRQYDSIGAGVITLGPDGRALDANAGLISLLGFSSDSELLAADFGERIFATRESLDALLSRVRREGEIGVIELHLRRCDGLPLIAAATVRAKWDEAGGIEHFQLTLIDIGDLKFAERHRRALERRFRRLFDTSAAGIMFGSLRRGTMDEANGRMREIAGLRPSDLPVLLDSVLADERPFLGAAVRAALESDGFAPPLETVYVRADGRRVATIVCAAMVDPLQGDFVAIVVERPAERAAVSADPVAGHLHASILEAIPALVARFNLEQRLTYCNAACRAWFGFPLTPTGLSLKDLLGLESLDPLGGEIELVLAGATSRATVEAFQVGGRPRPLAITLSPHRRGDGTVAGLVATMRHLAEPVAADNLHTSAENTYRMMLP
jgi:PAS domain-containing protein